MVGSIPPTTTNGLVPQLAEGAVREAVKCGFESHLGHMQKSTNMEKNINWWDMDYDYPDMRQYFKRKAQKEIEDGLVSQLEEESGLNPVQ